MLAASYWSLLAPAIEMSESVYGQWTFIHISVGFSLGGLFVYLADLLMSKLVSKNYNNNQMHLTTCCRSTQFIRTA